MGKRSRRRGEPAEAAAETPQDEAPAEDAPVPLRPDGRLRDVAMLVEEADYVYALYRWIVLTGEVPRAQDWLRREEWPHPDYVIDVFGSWEKFLQHADLPSSPLLARLREADEGARALAAREQQAERDLARVEDLRRQVETAKRRREAADAQRADLGARVERLTAQLERAETRAATAEAHLAERSRHAAVAAGPRTEASDEWLAAHEALQDELESVRAHRDDLLAQVEELREIADQDAKAIARLSTALGELSGAPEQEARPPRPLEPPATVAEAVRRAADRGSAPRLHRRRPRSARASPYRRPADVLDDARASSTSSRACTPTPTASGARSDRRPNSSA